MARTIIRFAKLGGKRISWKAPARKGIKATFKKAPKTTYSLTAATIASHHTKQKHRRKAGSKSL